LSYAVANDLSAGYLSLKKIEAVDANGQKVVSHYHDSTTY
jgi:hypothetical protein